MPVTVPDIITDVPQRADGEADFNARADAAWAALAAWSVQIAALATELNAALAAPLAALELSAAPRFVGRLTAGPGASEELTIAQVLEQLQGTGLAAALAGFRGLPQRSLSADYTLVAADAGRHLYHPGADTTARAWTIPSNAAVAFDVGAAVTFVNDVGAGAITIAITSDTLVWAGTGSTGSRTLAAGGMATAVKIGTTRWMISGTGLT